jgi:hypothetical protein
MQQRQLRLGDILDDYCPRERRVTNHAIVAMVEQDVKQTRCTTCDAEHEYKHARVPRQRRKSDVAPALASQASSGGPKRVVHEPDRKEGPDGASVSAAPDAAHADVREEDAASPPADQTSRTKPDVDLEEGPVHRQLIRATLPRPEGQPPPSRPAPDFTLRQPAGRHGRFRPRHARNTAPFHGNRSGNTSGGSGAPRSGGGGNRPPMMSRSGKRHGPGHKRSK